MSSLLPLLPPPRNYLPHSFMLPLTPRTTTPIARASDAAVTAHPRCRVDSLSRHLEPRTRRNTQTLPPNLPHPPAPFASLIIASAPTPILTKALSPLDTLFIHCNLPSSHTQELDAMHPTPRPVPTLLPPQSPLPPQPSAPQPHSRPFTRHLTRATVPFVSSSARPKRIELLSFSPTCYPRTRYSSHSLPPCPLVFRLPGLIHCVILPLSLSNGTLLSRACRAGAAVPATATPTLCISPSLVELPSSFPPPLLCLFTAFPALSPIFHSFRFPITRYPYPSLLILHPILFYPVPTFASFSTPYSSSFASYCHFPKDRSSREPAR